MIWCFIHFICFGNEENAQSGRRDIMIDIVTLCKVYGIL